MIAERIIRTGADYIVRPTELKSNLKTDPKTRKTHYGTVVYDPTVGEIVTFVGNPEGSTRIGDFYRVNPGTTVIVELVNPSGTRDGAHFAILEGLQNITRY